MSVNPKKKRWGGGGGKGGKRLQHAKSMIHDRFFLTCKRKSKQTYLSLQLYPPTQEKPKNPIHRSHYPTPTYDKEETTEHPSNPPSFFSPLPTQCKHMDYLSNDKNHNKDIHPSIHPTNSRIHPFHPCHISKKNKKNKTSHFAWRSTARHDWYRQ